MFFEHKATVERNRDGKIKKLTEVRVIEAESALIALNMAETLLLEEKVDYLSTAVNLKNWIEVVNVPEEGMQDSDRSWWDVTAQYIDIDSKKVKESFLVFAKDNQEATHLTLQHAGHIDSKAVKVAETACIEFLTQPICDG